MWRPLHNTVKHIEPNTTWKSTIPWICKHIEYENETRPLFYIFIMIICKGFVPYLLKFRVYPIVFWNFLRDMAYGEDNISEMICRSLKKLIVSLWWMHIIKNSAVDESVYRYYLNRSGPNLPLLFQLYSQGRPMGDKSQSWAVERVHAWSSSSQLSYQDRHQNICTAATRQATRTSLPVLLLGVITALIQRYNLARNSVLPWFRSLALCQ